VKVLPAQTTGTLQPKDLLNKDNHIMPFELRDASVLLQELIDLQKGSTPPDVGSVLGAGKQTAGTEKKEPPKPFESEDLKTLNNIKVQKLMGEGSADLTIGELAALKDPHLIGMAINPLAEKKSAVGQFAKKYYGIESGIPDSVELGNRFIGQYQSSLAAHQAEAADKAKLGLSEGGRVGDAPASAQEVLRNEGLVSLINDPSITQGSGSPYNPATSSTNSEVLNALSNAGMNVDEVFGEAASPSPPPQIIDKEAKLSRTASNVAYAALKTRLATQPIQIPPGSSPELERQKVQQGIATSDANIRNINSQITDRVNSGATAKATAALQEQKIGFLQDQFRFKQTNVAISAGIKLLENSELTGDKLLEAYNDLFQLMLNDAPSVTKQEQSFLDKYNPFKRRGVDIAPGGIAPRGRMAPSTEAQEEEERRYR